MKVGKISGFGKAVKTLFLTKKSHERRFGVLRSRVMCMKQSEFADLRRFFVSILFEMISEENAPNTIIIGKQQKNSAVLAFPCMARRSFRVFHFAFAILGDFVVRAILRTLKNSGKHSLCTSQAESFPCQAHLHYPNQSLMPAGTPKIPRLSPTRPTTIPHLASQSGIVHGKLFRYLSTSSHRPYFIARHSYNSRDLANCHFEQQMKKSNSKGLYKFARQLRGREAPRAKENIPAPEDSLEMVVRPEGKKKPSHFRSQSCPFNHQGELRQRQGNTASASGHKQHWSQSQASMGSETVIVRQLPVEQLSAALFRMQGRGKQPRKKGGLKGDSYAKTRVSQQMRGYELRSQLQALRRESQATTIKQRALQSLLGKDWQPQPSFQFA